jgi:squalene-hopene/tetraprenyl-beta-curcumene cyclase
MNTHWRQDVENAYQIARGQLLARRNADGFWTGRLASSAVSTATAVSALSVVRAAGHPAQEQLTLSIQRGVTWLVGQQNADGGWGDTDRSYSNIATTALAVSALCLADCRGCFGPVVERGMEYLQRYGFVEGIYRRYGRDRTFAVPILTNAALAGLLDWDTVPTLPFELACFPQSWYRFLRLPVVSYAIPALVAMGQVRHYFQPTRIAPWRWLRRACLEPSLSVLQRMQPDSGGFLEATPLTSFVVMSLAASGRLRHPVVERGLRFLMESMRSDGSWPIDTNLATWLTSLSVNALAVAGEDIGGILGESCRDWLLSCQHRQRHPFTGAAPGGWGWSDLSGAVPDADDTSGALVALGAWYFSGSLSDAQKEKLLGAALDGLRWLLQLQNADGGWPTFCRGWAKLPFDRSGADLTAHALRALHAWQPIWSQLPASSYVNRRRCERAVRRAFAYLERQQRPDGSWIPLWFGNQDDPQEENPVYGTSRVLLAYTAWRRHDTLAAQRGLMWLVRAQHASGDWGVSDTEDEPRSTNGSSIEETALAVEALSTWPNLTSDLLEALVCGATRLAQCLQAGDVMSAPIGLYFAKLWYYEELYPWVFSVAALGRLLRRANLLKEASVQTGPLAQSTSLR